MCVVVVVVVIVIIIVVVVVCLFVCLFNIFLASALRNKQAFLVISVFPPDVSQSANQSRWFPPRFSVLQPLRRRE